MSCKVTVDTKAAHEFIKRYFSGKGTKVDEVEIVPEDSGWHEVDITARAVDGRIYYTSHGPKRCPHCNSGKIKDLFIGSDGSYSFRCVDCGSYHTTMCRY